MAKRSRGVFHVIKNGFNLSSADYKALLVDILGESNAVGDLYVKQVDKVVSNWSSQSKPSFGKKSKITGAKIGVQVEVKEANPKKPVWKWVNKTGTKAHRIPKNGKTKMSFRWGGKGSYDAKTKTGSPPSHGGSGKTNGGIVTTGSVNHPGFQPRQFTKQLNIDARNAYKKRMRKVLVRDIKALVRAK